ncbi:hypothetical protein RFG22_08350 [Streptococcus ruminantium]|nr:hypothetical protein [Streptococcus ruminantium]MDQ8767703.1 hypothetical protein [Streptococcus ruminantium]MDQ8780760.1 hypothetical protein [Streptococcus ruminantium]
MDTVVDAAQGGNISPASIGTNLAINAITEGVSSKTVKGQKGEVQAVEIGNNIPEAYSGVKEASKYLQEQEIPREFRKQILESFEVGTIKVNQATSDTYGLRFYGELAKPEGRYLFETFTDQINRKNLALPPAWNTMEGIAQFKLREGTTYISGRVAPQLQMGTEYVGGAMQWYVNELSQLERIK